MDLFALSPTQEAGGQIALAAVLAFAGFLLLLPRPRGRSVAGGIAALIVAVAVFGTWLQTTYGNPMPDLIGSVLFVLFSLGALGFGTVLVVQRNPARGALAFAFVILSTCGLFLLLAAPFLMAATIIIYAGAIIVTFLFVLMLSQAQGESNENDRTREPLLGVLAGFAFVGLVLFTLYLTSIGNSENVAGENATTPPKIKQRLPAQVLTPVERKELADVIAKLNALSGDQNIGNAIRLDDFEEIKETLSRIVGVSYEEEATQEATKVHDDPIRKRLEKSPGKPGSGKILYREDEQTRAVLERTASIRALNGRVYKQVENYLVSKSGDLATVKGEIRKLRDEVVLLYGSAELPARNVENLGFLLYADHLLAIELAGTLLLVATIGAVAIAQRKGTPA
ncbi:MAG TPA: NADH-quinone oxidoreductase subunit J [Gemmata sp.]|nr:NADH-quinone oxidoreductase subunit J [Gemmata sp.]